MAVQNENALPNGTVLKYSNSEYRIERYLGAGGFGITYLVSGTVNVSGNTISSKFCIKEHFLSSDCERNHKTLSVVCSKPAKHRVEDGKKDFISEAKRLRDKIKHSHIVRVKDVFEAYDTAYYVMEFLDGKSLRNYIKKRGACAEDEATALMLPIIRAIGYLHDQNITHLDIKPDNIMIVENGRGVVSPTLIDFGLSKHYDKKGKATSTIRVMATSDGYSPVEQYQGIETFQPTADIYALAATYVYCVTGDDPRKSADIRPGEIRELLQGKVSESVLATLLNAMKPSQYERTQSVREFMSQLCPDEDSENWDVECDNNITDPIFFRKRENTKSFFSRLKNIFFGKEKSPKLLDMPDVSIRVNLLYPEGNGFSKQVWLCFHCCNTVQTYVGDKQVDDEDFGGIHDDVSAYIQDSGLLENNHWENEQSQSDCIGDITASITFFYSDGREYNREVKNVNVSNRLCSTILRLLNCPSIKDIVFNYDKSHYINEKEIKKTEPIFLKSSLLAYKDGMLTSITLDQWRMLDGKSKSAFNPYIVEVEVENKRIGLFVEERSNIAFNDIRNTLQYFEKQLNPSGVSGYERGECRLLTSDEMYLLEDNTGLLKNTFDEWGINGMSVFQWVMDNGRITPFIRTTGTDQRCNVQPFVKYFGTVVAYSPDIKDEIKGIEIILNPHSSAVLPKKVRLSACEGNRVDTSLSESLSDSHVFTFDNQLIPEDIISYVTNTELLSFNGWIPQKEKSDGPKDLINYEVTLKFEFTDGTVKTYNDVGDVNEYSSEPYIIAESILMRDSIIREVFKYETELYRSKRYDSQQIDSTWLEDMLDCSYLYAIKNSHTYKISKNTWYNMIAKERMSYFPIAVEFVIPYEEYPTIISVKPYSASKDSWVTLLDNLSNEINSMDKRLSPYMNISIPNEKTKDNIMKYRNNINLLLRFWNALPIESEMAYYKVLNGGGERELYDYHIPDAPNDFDNIRYTIHLIGDLKSISSVISEI